MEYTKNKNLLLVLMLFLIFPLKWAFARDFVDANWAAIEVKSKITIESVKPIDINNFEINVTESVKKLDETNKARIELLEDSQMIEKVQKLDPKKVSITLNQNFIKWVKYNIVLLAWGESFMTFTLEKDSNLINLLIKNDKLKIPSDVIDSIKIINDNSFEVNFNKPVSNELEFMILKEIRVKSIASNKDKVLSVTTLDAMSDKKSYILTVLELLDAKWRKVDKTKAISNFITNYSNDQKLITTIKKEEIKEPISTEVKKEDFIKQEEIIVEEKKEELTKTDQVALTTEVTPDVWTKTNILIITSLLLAVFIMVKRRREV